MMQYYAAAGKRTLLVMQSEDRSGEQLLGLPLLKGAAVHNGECETGVRDSTGGDSVLGSSPVVPCGVPCSANDVDEVRVRQFSHQQGEFERVCVCVCSGRASGRRAYQRDGLAGAAVGGAQGDGGDDPGQHERWPSQGGACVCVCVRVCACVCVCVMCFDLGQPRDDDEALGGLTLVEAQHGAVASDMGVVRRERAESERWIGVYPDSRFCQGPSALTKNLDPVVFTAFSTSHVKSLCHTRHENGVVRGAPAEHRQPGTNASWDMRMKELSS